MPAPDPAFALIGAVKPYLFLAYSCYPHFHPISIHATP
jgi:hypothetical protein